MTVTKLRPGDSTICRPGTLEVDWQVRGASAQAVRVELEALTAAGPSAVAVQAVGPQSLLLSSLPEAVALVARPQPNETAFADAITFQAQISLRVGNADADQVVLAPVDVSGTASAVLFTVAPAPGGWEITAAPAGRSAAPPAGSPAPEPGSRRLPPEPPTATVSPLRRAEFATRRYVGGAVALPADQRTTMVVAVDRSASMLPHQRSGALSSILELILGVNAVCGTDSVVPMWRMSREPGPIRPDLSESSVGGYVENVLGDQALTSGTALAPLIDLLPRDAGRQTVFLITDDVPPDLDASAAALRARPDPPGSLSWHLLVLARHRTDPLVRAEPWRDELRPLAPLADGGLLTVSAIAPDDTSNWLANRLASPDELAAVVSGLGVRPATTTTTEAP
jgi:hypothetical protein